MVCFNTFHSGSGNIDSVGLTWHSNVDDAHHEVAGFDLQERSTLFDGMLLLNLAIAVAWGFGELRSLTTHYLLSLDGAILHALVPCGFEYFEVNIVIMKERISNFCSLLLILGYGRVFPEFETGSLMVHPGQLVVGIPCVSGRTTGFLGEERYYIQL
ncbi:hypothetical protein CRG98_027190 [Punica granatum]|uniref:Uncharacterized protein n=1 Tax=Punica granatum TaxID=22663 RepID=A0A2I0J872_PUNGR|nr:hypothetical protein CRG98_027190 [Punica granatum]